MIAIRPPVDVPQIMSKKSQGFGGSFGSIHSIILCKIRNDDSPWTPPPSRHSREILALLCSAICKGHKRVVFDSIGRQNAASLA